MENRLGKDAWLSGFAKSSVKVYKAGYDLFIKFMNKTEEESWNDQRLIKEREEDVKTRNYGFEHKLIEFYNWLKEYNPNFSDNTRKSYLKAIRSFFSFHRLDVKFTQQQKTKVSKKPKPKRHYYEFTVDDIKKMAAVSKPKERYILLAGKDLGLRASDFVNLKQGTFIAHDLDAEPPISLGEIYTLKEGVIAKPFLGFDGRDAAKQWLTVLRSEGKYDPDKPMLEIGESELTEILKRLTQRAGVNTGHEKIRFHQLRVFLVTRLAQIMEVNRWKQVVGKQISEGAYVKPFKLREDYAKVMPLTSIKETSGIGQAQELKDLKNALKYVESENRIQKTRVDELSKTVEDQKTAFEDMKQILQVQQRTINHLTKELGKATRGA